MRIKKLRFYAVTHWFEWNTPHASVFYWGKTSFTKWDVGVSIGPFSFGFGWIA